MGSQYSEIGVATSQSLELGTWFDHGSIRLPQNSGYNLIDPYIFQETPDSIISFTFGSYWTGIQQMEMSSYEQLVSWAGQQSAIKNVIRNTTEQFAVQEGAILHKHGDFYYIFFSVGQC